MQQDDLEKKRRAFSPRKCCGKTLKLRSVSGAMLSKKKLCRTCFTQYGLLGENDD